MTARERTSWLSQVAVAAAKAGQTERAMEIWGRCANFDRTDLRRLDEMARAGLADGLANFYDAMAKADPATTAPARARRMLGR